MPDEKIKGGFIVLARSIDKSEIADSPPHVREIWLYLLKNAAFKDHERNGRKIKRGTLHTTPTEVLNALSWHVGYRIERYKKNDYEKTMKVLRKAEMIAVTKTAFGSLVEVLNYSFYQDINNYEGRTLSQTPSQTENGHEPDDIEEEGSKKEEEGKEEKPLAFPEDSFEYKLAKKFWLLAANANEAISRKKPDGQKWAKDFDLIIRIDKNPPEEVERIIEWAFKDSFWSKTIQSPSGVRKNYSTMFGQMNSKPSGGKQTSLVDQFIADQTKPQIKEIPQDGLTIEHNTEA